MEFDIGIWYHIKLKNGNEFDVRYMPNKEDNSFYFLDCKGNKFSIDRLIPQIIKSFIAGNPCP